MKPQSGDFRLGYRGDVEGLRAIAILLVIAAHAKVAGFQGGFIGVDVFYILSGYLITGLLVQEAATTGRMRFANFYARRLRRLLPALFLMLVITCVVAKLVIPPTELPNQLSNAFSAALWLSNFQFAFWNMDYFAPSADTALYLHTWSLGVEEQFYLVWPLLIVLVLGAWKGSNAGARLARLKWLFVGIFAVSFALSTYWTYRAPLFGFYLMPSRAWQFALGGIVFLAVGSPAFQVSTSFAHSTWLRPLGWLGLGMVVLAGIIIPPTAPYPGMWALLPSAGAAFALAGGAQQQSWLARTLSLRLMQALGRVSYSWYLWHWPVLVLGATLLDIRSGWNRAGLVLLSLLIAAASYHLFETPIRHNRRLVSRPGLAVVAALVVMVVGALALRGWQAQAKAFAQTPSMAAFTAARHDEASVYAMGCFGPYRSTQVLICSFGDPHAKHTIALLGDSKAAQWVPPYREVFTKLGWHVLVITKSACPMVDASYIAAPLRRTYSECNKWRDEVLRKVASLRPNLVVLSESYRYPFSEDEWIDGTKSVLRSLAQSADQIIVMRPTPELPVNGPLCLEPRGRLYAALAPKSRCRGIANGQKFMEISEWIKSAASSFPSAHFVDMTRSVCPDNECRAKVNDIIVFSDAGHMTGTFARALAPALADMLQNDLDISSSSSDEIRER